MFRSLMAVLTVALCAASVSAADCTRCCRQPVRTVVAETAELGVDAVQLVGKTLHGAACLVREHVVQPTVAFGRRVHCKVEQLGDERSCVKCERLKRRAERAVQKLNDCGCVPSDYEVEPVTPAQPEEAKAFDGKVTNGTISTT
jgi:hypothetical protein